MRSEEILLAGKLENALIHWSRKEYLTAKQIINSLLSELEKKAQNCPNLILLNAEAHTVKGTWLADSCSQNSVSIMNNFLEKAIDILKKNETLHNKSSVWKAHLTIARYADAQYEILVNYITSAAFQTKRDLLQESHKEIKKIKSQTGCNSIEQKRALNILSRQAFIDELEVKSVENDKQNFLLKAVANYLACLKGTDAHDIRVFRVMALWFQNSGNNEVNNLIKSGLKEIQTYKFLPLLYQLAARMGTQSASTFASVLTELIYNVCLDHPYHSLPVILALYNANSDVEKQAPEKKKMKCSNKKSFNEELCEASRNLIVSLKNTKLCELITDMESLTNAYIDLAYIRPPQNVKKARIPEQHPILKIKNKTNIAVITDHIKVDPSGTYEKIPGIKKFESEYELCGGINIPKIVTCLGTDGLPRTQLVKGSDDMRQDAVMQQVFNLVNWLLSQRKQTKKRKLGIRTYKVTPLSQQSGVLQWCEGTEPLGEYLIGADGASGAHKKYFPQHWVATKCRRAMANVSLKSLEDKKAQFMEICRNFPPAFRFFFLEHFQEPASWFEHRLAYNQSVATSSVVGYILGLGDRHVKNILIDKKTGEVIHIDFGIAFEKGKILPTPETVPFRLTRDIVDGMGVCGVEGVFKRCCEKTMEVMRESCEVLHTILEVLLFDPLYDWTMPTKSTTSSQTHTEEQTDDTYLLLRTANFREQNNQEVNKLAERALMRVRQKLQGVEDGISLSVEGHINFLIQQAQDTANLCRLFSGWQAYL